MRPTVVAAGLGAASGALVALGASRRWQLATDRAVAELGRGPTSAGIVSFDELADLPTPVRRYFERVLRDGRPKVRAARVRQTGRFRTRESGNPETGWAPFTAVQHFTAAPPGFVWDARIRMAPLVSVRVRDGYVAGHAMMRGAVAGLVPVVNAADDAALRAGSLQRWLAEAVWLPTALLPGGAVSWTPIDPAHARATVADGAVTAALDFEFAPGGEIVAVRAEQRPREIPGKPGEYQAVPWGGRYGAYEEHGGMRVPTEAEVYWVIERSEQPYYRGRNVFLDYDFAVEDRP